MDVLGRRPYAPQKGVPKPEELLSDVESEFLDWLIDPHREGNQKQWAEARGLRPLFLSEIKRKQYFQRAWRERADRVIGGPERIQLVADALFQAAQQDWRAAQAYLMWVEKITPPRKPAADDGSLREMSDEDFMAKLAEFVKGAKDNGEQG